MKNQKRKSKIVPIIFAIIILGGISSLFSDDEPEKEGTPVSEVAVESIVTESSVSSVASESSEESKEPELTIEEKSKQWVAETMPNNDLRGIIDAYNQLEDEKLKEMISVGHRKGTQWEDDFDIIGEEIIVNGVVGQRTDTTRISYRVYIGDMDISQYENYHTFLKDNPEEEKYSVIVRFDGDNNALEWSIGEQVTFKADISNFPTALNIYMNPAVDNARPVE